jgi:hypothetical protein
VKRPLTIVCSAGIRWRGHTSRQYAPDGWVKALNYRFTEDFGLDERERRLMGEAAVAWFTKGGHGRSWFICGGAADGQPLTAERVEESGESLIAVRLSRTSELLDRHRSG